MKPFNENARCPKCDYDAIKSKFYDGEMPLLPPYMGETAEDAEERNQVNTDCHNTAHERECLIRTCSRCEYKWNESVHINHEKP